MQNQAQSVTELIGVGLSHLTKKLPNSHRAMILLQDPVSGNMVVRAAHNVDTEQLGGASAMSTRLLKSARQRGKGCLVLDASRDTQFRGFREEALAEFRSALCVPILDGGHRTIGILYADHPQKAGAFTPGDQTETERFGRELGRQIEKARKKGFLESPRSARQAQPPSPLAQVLGPITIPLAMLGLAVLWAVVGAGLSTASRPGEPAGSPTAAEVATAGTAEPRMVAQSFLRQLRLRQHEQAWGMLSPKLQKSLPAEKFSSQVENWLADDINRWELESRQISEGRRGETILMLQVSSGPRAPRRSTWKWTLRKTENGWRIDSMDGAPLSEHRLGKSPRPGG